ncbi:hypothetical protein H0911_24845 [Bacillus sp. HSTU-bmb18]|uniref:hypothetical protein n=1 Tax=Bacillus sp. HSTU-bmb18 TaxID=2755318 RepID=UPI0034C61177
MSHFAVMVQIPKEKAGDRKYLESVMAPFDEKKEVTPYIYKTKQELIEEYNKSSEANETSYEAWLQYWYIDDGEQIDEEGNHLSTYNPNSKWDWYVVGGRWSNLLIDKDGNSCDAAYAGELDLQAMKDKNVRSAKNDWKAMQESPNDVLKVLMYGARKGETEEEYVQRNSKTLSTYAVIDKQGNWIAKGDMGWFGMSSETDVESDDWDGKFTERFINPLEAGDVVVIVDCHI